MKVKVHLNNRDWTQDVILPSQVHGDRIIEILTGNEDLDNCDALITKDKSFSLGVRTADCATICFSDGDKIGIAHAGWRGLCLGLIEKMLSNYNVNKLEVFVGPFNHSFEIQRDFCFDMIKGKFGEKFLIEEDGKLTFLFKDAIMSVLPENTEFDPRNTYLDPSLPSFRRDKTNERIITVVSF